MISVMDYVPSGLKRYIKQWLIRRKSRTAPFIPPISVLEWSWVVDASLQKARR